MIRKAQVDAGKKKIFSLLTKEFQTTKTIQKKGVNLGIYNNWNSYNKYLQMLLLEDKVEQFKTPSGIFWRKK